jgi:FkbM family methyltransferase
MDNQTRWANEAIELATAAGYAPNFCDYLRRNKQMFVMDRQITFANEFFGQALEQQIIENFFKDHVGNFLVIGAANGIDQSWNLLKSGWNVVYCEPDPVACKYLLETTQPWSDQVTIVNSAINTTSGLTPFYVSPTVGLSSVCPLPEIDSREIIINSIAISDLFEFIGYNFDYVQVDVEGLDHQLITAMDWNKLANCKMICIETGLKSWQHLLEHGEYVLTDNLGANTIYRRQQFIDSNKNLKTGNE